ncbi:MAG: hypothetical protein AAGD11_10245 [Planctomycetota bacterium]
MPAQLRIFPNGGQTTCVWIQSDVVRVGASSDCDIEIQGLDSHLATVVFREGRYLLVNRSQQPLLLDGQEIAPGGEAIWPDQAVLKATKEIDIALVCHADPTPVADEPWRSLPSYYEPDRQREAAKQRRKEQICYAVSLVALLLTAMLWKMPKQPSNQVQLSQMLQTYADSPAGARQQCSSALRWIRKAYHRQQNGELQRARNCYLQARELLVSIPAQSNQLRNLMLDFVNSEVARI